MHKIYFKELYVGLTCVFEQVIYKLSMVFNIAN